MTKRLKFPLFQTPLDLAHDHWKVLLKPGDCVVDATSGNGHDTLFLANIVLNPQTADNPGTVVAIDNQQLALNNSQKLLKDHLSDFQMEHVFFYNQCHSSFPSILQKESVTLFVYNLGYLPGGNKNLTTAAPTTLQSLKSAVSLIAPGGAISITCYPGHEAGKPEEEIVLNFAVSLDPLTWSCCHHRWVNRRNAPSLFLIQRGLESRL